MPDESEIHGNFDKCPYCGKVIADLSGEFDDFESRLGATVLETVCDGVCPHCNRDIAIVAEVTYRVYRPSDSK